MQRRKTVAAKRKQNERDGSRCYPLRNNSRTNFAAKFAFGLASVFGSLAMLSVKSEAGLVVSLANIENNRQLSNNPAYKWSAAVKREGSNGITFASGVAIAPDVYINAGHYTPINGSLVAFHREIVFGSNYNTSTSRYEVDRTQRYPGYVFGDTSTIDLGVGWTKNFIQGFDTPVTFGTVLVGQNGTMVDYGNIADPTTIEMPSQGDRLAGTTERVENLSSVYPESLYDFLRFDRSDPLSTQGLNFSSGAGWYNAIFNLSHLTIAGTLGTNGGDTIALDLNIPEIQSYLQPIIQDSWNRYYASVPEPGSLALTGSVGLFALGFRRRRRTS